MTNAEPPRLHCTLDDDRQIVHFSIGDCHADMSFAEIRLYALWLLEQTSLSAMYVRHWMDVGAVSPLRFVERRDVSRLDYDSDTP